MGFSVIYKDEDGNVIPTAYCKIRNVDISNNEKTVDITFAVYSKKGGRMISGLLEQNVKDGNFEAFYINSSYNAIRASYNYLKTNVSFLSNAIEI